MRQEERFTELAQEALAASQELVRQYKHSQWDVEHILLALLQQERGLVGDILREFNIDVEAVRQQVEATLGENTQGYLRDGTNLCYTACCSTAKDG